jgi:hypothetical protein
MTGHEDNVGFLTTGSGVKQFQLSLWGYFVPRCLFFTATTARPASLPKSRFPETYEVPTDMIGRQKRNGSGQLEPVTTRTTPGSVMAVGGSQ